ncbi:hypothetical protein APV28_3618 [Comamonas testosteroni]|nr:hypothetical protein APV28_3618 [Comamonas testosteroni]
MQKSPLSNHDAGGRAIDECVRLMVQIHHDEALLQGLVVMALVGQGPALT